MTIAIKPFQVERCVEQLRAMFSKAYPDDGKFNLPKLEIMRDGSGGITEWRYDERLRIERELMFTFDNIGELVEHLQEKAGEE